MVNTVPFLLQITLKCHVKYQSLGTPFLKGNRMLCCKDRHTLLLGCLIAFFRYITMIERAPNTDSIYKATYGPHCVISVKNKYQSSSKISVFRLPLRTGNGMLCCKERHTLMVECFMTFLGYMWKLRGATDIIYKPLMVHMVSFLPKTTLIFH